MTVAAVDPPDAAWAPALRRFLGHKEPPRQIEIAGELDGTLDELAAVFYVGVVAEEPVTVARAAGAYGAAIWGHVYTSPAWRGRGASRLLHDAALPDLRRRACAVLTLGADPRGHAYRMYAAVGFRPVAPGSGAMAWGEEAPPPPSPPGPTVGPARWADWGWISAAACAAPAPEERLPRSRVLAVRGPGFVGGAFVDAMLAGTPLLVLRRGAGAIGWGDMRDPDDLYVRPDCAADRPALAAALRRPQRSD